MNTLLALTFAASLFELVAIKASEPDDADLVTVTARYICTQQVRRICHGKICIPQWRPVVATQKASTEAVVTQMPAIIAALDEKALGACLLVKA